MKGLWKYISPFAPDQSGAAGVLYELGGILVICDAGGCAGNICGFDEPRWFTRKSAIFSAGLRDMDAILGRDDRLVAKLCDTAAVIDANFAAVIGTPVPAVIGTDYRALKRLAEKKSALPILAIDTNGVQLYDKGEEKAYLELFRTFANRDEQPREGTAGIIGATPLSMSSLSIGRFWRQALSERGWSQVYCYGMEGTLDEVRHAGQAVKNFVVSPSGLKAAAFLKDTFGTPYEVICPELERLWGQAVPDWTGKKVLIVQQQVMANTMRSLLRQQGKPDVTVATWFMLDRTLKEEGDMALREEDSFIDLVRDGAYDVILGDGLLQRAVPDFKGLYIDWPHFAVSGRMWEYDR